MIRDTRSGRNFLPDPKGTVFRIQILWSKKHRIPDPDPHHCKKSTPTCCFISFGFSGARQPRLGRVYETGCGGEGGGGGGADRLLPRLVAGQGVLLLLVQRPAQRQLTHTLTLPPQGDLLHTKENVEKNVGEFPGGGWRQGCGSVFILCGSGSSILG